MWLASTKTAVVSMSSAVGSATRNFIDGVNGTEIKNNRMYVRESSLREAFDRIVQEPGLNVNPNRDSAIIAGTIVVGAKAPAIIDGAGKFIAPICGAYGAGAAAAASRTIDYLIQNADKLQRTATVMRNVATRPYINSTQTIQQIMRAPPLYKTLELRTV